MCGIYEKTQNYIIFKNERPYLEENFVKAQLKTWAWIIGKQLKVKFSDAVLMKWNA